MIREASEADAPLLGTIFLRAIREGPSPYSDAQRAAWAPELPDPEEWAARLAAQRVAVAERDRAPVGFMTLARDGYIDLAFILPVARGQGNFAALCDRIEQWARGDNCPRLWTFASLMAEPAFCRAGFRVTDREEIDCEGQRLQRARMEKKLR